ncbi:MAG: ABC transporter ATP-binding protein [Solirubrobacterales bacterium]
MAVATATVDGRKAPRADQPAELIAESVTVRFGGLVALEDVTFSVREGEIVGLIGPNGAGKTTLLNVLTGFIPTSGGAVKLSGVDVSSWSPERLVRHHVARTFQGARLFGRLTVRENIEVGAVGQGTSMRVARERSAELIGTYRLGDYAERLASELPAGVRRRLGIARALASEPKLILMDEPAAGLNEAERSELVHLVSQVRESSGSGIGIVEHSMPVIMELCDRIQVLDEGRTIAKGTPTEVRQDAQVRAAYLGGEAK